MDKPARSIVVVGDINHGKSSIIGRLLADTHSLPKGKLEQVEQACQKHSKPFEHAFLIDSLKDEQSQGLTIDTARIFFKTAKRRYIIIDTPGHIELLKNMITGASRADTALLVIDAKVGIQENTKRHGFLLSMLGIKQLTVLVNKMDLVSYGKDIFEGILKDYTAFLSGIGIKPLGFIPVSAKAGDMIVDRLVNLHWYNGHTVIETLEGLEKDADIEDKSFRMPVQDVYRFNGFQHNRSIIAGRIESGSIGLDEGIVFYPSGKRGIVKSIERFNLSNQVRAGAGLSIGLTFSEELNVQRGEIAAREGQAPPGVASRMRASLFWLGKEEMAKGKEYTFKLGTNRMPVELEAIKRIIDVSGSSLLQPQDIIKPYNVADCILKLTDPIAFDRADKITATSRFVIVDGWEISAGGIVLEALYDQGR